MKKQKTWVKFRHKVVTALVRPFILLTAVLRYHIRIDRFSGEGARNWLILSNHQTDFDQFFVGLAFRNPVYYLALEDLFSNGFISKVISWLVAPVPFMKATNDVKAVMSCIRIAREGGNLAVFPEGNRTYSGRTCYIKPSIAALAKKLGLPIAIFRIEGGYGVKPRWARSVRGGRMSAGVRRVIEPEEYQSLSREDLYDLICRELWVDESATDAAYPSKASAEGLERVLYVCPRCGLSEFETHGQVLRCKNCGKRHRYTERKRLEALDGTQDAQSPAEWYDFQEAYIRSLDLSPYYETPLYTETARLSEVIVYRRKQPLLRRAEISIFADRLEIRGGAEPMILPYADIRAMTCVADHKLNIFYLDRIFQLKGRQEFNALKYCNIYYHAKFVKEGHTDGEFQFLGL